MAVMQDDEAAIRSLFAAWQRASLAKDGSWVVARGINNMVREAPAA